MGFTSRKIEEKSSPFLKEKSFKNPQTRVFFGPEIINPPKRNFFLSRNIFIWLIAAFIVLLYLTWGLVNIFVPPKITIYYPPDNYVAPEKIITIKGKVSEKSFVYINNQPVNLDRQNIFEEKITLLPGVNTIKISARKKIGQERTIFRQIIVK